MNPKLELILGIFLGAGLLFVALKYGTIGGSGAGATRDRNPFLFWLAVSTTAFIEVIFVIILLSQT